MGALGSPGSQDLKAISQVATRWRQHTAPGRCGRQGAGDLVSLIKRPTRVLPLAGRWASTCGVSLRADRAGGGLAALGAGPSLPPNLQGCIPHPHPCPGSLALFTHWPYSGVCRCGRGWEPKTSSLGLAKSAFGTNGPVPYLSHPARPLLASDVARAIEKPFISLH